MSRSTLTTHITEEVQKRYALWVAEWGNTLNYSGNTGIWQFSSRGFVDGITGNVDLDIGYKDYPTIIRSNGLNGYGKVTNPTPAEPDATATVTVTIGKDTYKGTLVKE